MEISSSRLSLITGLSLSLAIIVSTCIGSYTFFQAKQLNNVLSVSGSADKVITSDTVKWTSSFSENADTLGLIQANDRMKKHLDTIRAYFTSQGMKESDLTVQPLVVTPYCSGQNGFQYDKYGNQNCGANPVAGYTLQQTLVVESHDVEKMTSLAQNAASYMIQNGIVFTTAGLEYYYGALSDLKLEMLAEATKNASARAKKIVEGTGKKLGNLQSANMGVFQVTAVNSTEISDYGAYDTSSKEKRITAVVKTSFSIR